MSQWTQRLTCSLERLPLGNIALVLAQQKRRILYVEGKTDLEILRAWAAVLEHRLLRFLQEPLWKRMAETN